MSDNNLFSDLEAPHPIELTFGGEIKEDVRDAAADAADAAKDAAGSAADAAGTVADAAADAAKDAAGSAADAAGAVKDAAADAVDTAANAADAVKDTVQEAVAGAEEAISEAGQAAQSVTDAAKDSAAAVASGVQSAAATAQAVASETPGAAAMQEFSTAAAEAAQAAQTAKEEAEKQISQLMKELEEVGRQVNLTDDEQKMVDDFSTKIDLHDSNAILTYGAGTQKKMSDFTDAALDSVRNKDLGEVGEMISGLVTELKDFDVDEEDKGFFKIFKKQANKAVALRSKYDKAEASIDDIVSALEGHQVTLLKDVAMLDKMYDLNAGYFKELSMYILAGKKRLAEVRGGELKELQETAEKTGLANDAQAAKDLEALCDRFEKKLYDLELTRQVALQTGPQIRLVQDSDTIMAEKIQSTIVNTIPLWKNQMVIALGVEHSNQAAKAQHEVSDLTNDLLKKNAEKLKTATIETAKEAERGVVDIETLRDTNATLISTLDEVVRIQEEGRTKRAAAELEMQKMESELKSKLLDISRIGGTAELIEEMKKNE